VPPREPPDSHSSAITENWESQLRKGLLDFLLLLLVRDTHRYGYEMISILRSEVGLDISEGTIYPILARLLRAELVVSTWVERDGGGAPRKYYKLTAEGRRVLKQMQASWIRLGFDVQRLLLHR